MLHLLFDPTAWIGFLTLTALELVLGIDNIIFVSILVDRIPPEQREMARRLGLSLAMLMRIGLLLVLSWIIGLTRPLFFLFDFSFGGRDLILIAGGLFLLWKSTQEIHALLEGETDNKPRPTAATLGKMIFQIVLIDLVFSLDSIITAVGMVTEVGVMIAAVVASVGLMILFAPVIGRFIAHHPTIKMLALSFLIVVGLTLLLEGFGNHVPRGYIYFAMAFSVAVEILNIQLRKKKE